MADAPIFIVVPTSKGRDYAINIDEISTFSVVVDDVPEATRREPKTIERTLVVMRNREDIRVDLPLATFARQLERTYNG